MQKFLSHHENVLWASDIGNKTSANEQYWKTHLKYTKHQVRPQNTCRRIRSSKETQSIKHSSRNPKT